MDLRQKHRRTYLGLDVVFKTKDLQSITEKVKKKDILGPEEYVYQEGPYSDRLLPHSTSPFDSPELSEVTWDRVCLLRSSGP